MRIAGGPFGGISQVVLYIWTVVGDPRISRKVSSGVEESFVTFVKFVGKVAMELGYNFLAMHEKGIMRWTHVDFTLLIHTCLDLVHQGSKSDQILYTSPMPPHLRDST